MGQRIELTDRGLSNVEIGEKITVQELEWLKPLNTYPNKENLRVGLNENYYYMIFDSLTLNSIGIPKDIFIATDSTNKVVSIFIFLSSTSETFTETIDNIFSSSSLNAQSGISSQSSSILKHWKKEDISLLFRKNTKSKYSKITIQNINDNKNFSNINIE